MKLFNQNKSAFNPKLSEHTRFIAVTGSSGKTSTAFLIYHILHHGGLKVALFASSGLHVAGEIIDDEFQADSATSASLKQILSKLGKNHLDFIIVETPESALARGAFDGFQFDSAVLTSMTTLDSAEEIFKPVEMVVDEGFVVVNADTDFKDWIVRRSNDIPQNIFAAWVSTEQVQEFKQSLTGNSFQYEGGFFQTKLFTDNHLLNLILAIRLCVKYVGMDMVDRSLTRLKYIPGRMELLRTEPCNIIIDQANKYWQVEHSLSQLKTMSSGRIICILGANGQIDIAGLKSATPAANYADIVLFTAQNPGTEQVAEINSRLAQAAEADGLVLLERISDRDDYSKIDKDNLKSKLERVIANHDIPAIAFDESSPYGRQDCIKFALEIANPEDTIIIFGKGDERTIDFGKVIYDWHDGEMVLKLLAEAGLTAA